jgi:hypothetical protein
MNADPRNALQKLSCEKQGIFFRVRGVAEEKREK